MGWRGNERSSVENTKIAIQQRLPTSLLLTKERQRDEPLLAQAKCGDLIPFCLLVAFSASLAARGGHETQSGQ